MLVWLASVSDPDPRALRTAFNLWTVLVIIVGFLVISLAVLVSIRRTRLLRASGRARKRRGRPIPSAWEEAGRRAVPIRMDEPPPEVLPEDRS